MDRFLCVSLGVLSGAFAFELIAAGLVFTGGVFAGVAGGLLFLAVTGD